MNSHHTFDLMPKITRLKIRIASIACLIGALLSACGSANSGKEPAKPQGEIAHLKYSSDLELIECPEGYTVATLRNAWDTTRVLHTYVLVPDTMQLPDELPEGTVVRTPLRRSIVYSSVHNQLISELGALSAISGVCDPQYIYEPVLASRIADGTVADCGSSMAPNLEKIVTLEPGAILLSPYENSNDYGQLGKIGIPLIECSDYMETSPLGRAEWVKFYGLLYGREVEADSLFAATEAEYNRLKGIASNVTTRPTAIMDLIWNQVWYQPGAESTMGIMLRDAGGQSVGNDIDKSGSVGFTAEEMLYRAENADVWLIRYSQATPLTLKQLAKDNQIYSRFQPYKKGKVYGCQTSQTHFYEETPFHPDRLLASLIVLLHPELADSVETAPAYFIPLQ